LNRRIEDVLTTGSAINNIKNISYASLTGAYHLLSIFKNYPEKVSNPID
jgi:hypothetical protein